MPRPCLRILQASHHLAQRAFCHQPAKTARRGLFLRDNLPEKRERTKRTPALAGPRSPRLYLTLRWVHKQAFNSRAVETPHDLPFRPLPSILPPNGEFQIINN